MRQDYIIKNLEKKIGPSIQKEKFTKDFKTPGTPCSNILQGEEEDMLIEEQRCLFSTGVGTLLYLVKHTRTDLANAVRELWQTMWPSVRGQTTLTPERIL